MATVWSVRLSQGKKTGAGVALLMLAWLPDTLAQTSVAKAFSDTSAQTPSLPSDTADALPGIHRVGVPGLGPESGTKMPRFGAGATLGYGYTEPQNGEEASHHRLNSSVAAAVAPWPFLAAALRVDFRHDVHGDDPLGADSGSTFDFTPLLRGGADIGAGIYLGGEARLPMLGASAPGGSGIDPIFDARLLASYLGFAEWVFSTSAGYRMPHSGTAVEQAALLRAGDRVVLGLNEFDQLVLGLGVLRRLQLAGRSTDFFGELSWDLAVGNGAPGAFQSPLMGTLGLRHEVRRGWWLQGLLDITLGDRAPSEVGDPLVPIPPRVALLVGLNVAWPDLAKASKVSEAPAEEVDEEPVEEAAVKPKPVAPIVILGGVKVVIVDGTGHPISDAEVTATVVSKAAGGPSAPTGEGNEGVPQDLSGDPIVLPLEERNVYVSSEIPVGEVELLIEADLLKSHRQRVTVVEGEPVLVRVELQPAGEAGALLRGLVRSFRGQGISADIRVLPGDHVVTCDEEGEFVLELPPGEYEVIIEAEGFRTQKRKLQVVHDEVTVLNADLQRAE